jgi:hypothetical protein
MRMAKGMLFSLRKSICQRRRKNQPRGGSKVYHLGIE